MKYSLIGLCWLLLLFPSFPAFAQDGGAAVGWPVVQQCLTPTPPPEGWAFDGTILLKGYAGIHGVNDAWATPRVLAFFREDSADNESIFDGVLSPDGHWYVQTRGRFIDSEAGTFATIEVNKINFYSTLNSDESRSISWHNVYAVNNYGGGRSLRWWGSDQVVYEAVEDSRLGESKFRPESTFLIDPSTGETVAWTSPVDPMSDYFFAAPDREHIVLNSLPGTYDGDAWGLYSIDNELLRSLPLVYSVVWTPDSAFFAAGMYENTGVAKPSVTVFDREGEPVDTLLSFSETEWIGDTAWSPNARYLAFTLVNTDSGNYGLYHRSLYIVDLDNHQIVDPCLQISGGLGWSPTGSQLAVMAGGNDQRPIYVFDLERDGLYPAAYHSGTIIGWRAD